VADCSKCLAEWVRELATTAMNSMAVAGAPDSAVIQMGRIIAGLCDDFEIARPPGLPPHLPTWPRRPDHGKEPHPR
jgi:hypothetical protein